MTDREHQREITGYEDDIDGLARDVARLTYDQTLQFVTALRHELQDQAREDFGRKRVQLAAALTRTVHSLEAVQGHLQEVWQIAEPHMTPHERGMKDE